MTTVDLANRVQLNIPSFTVSPSQQFNSNTFKRVQFLDGSYANIPSVQFPAKNSMKIANLWRYAAQGNYNTVLQTGGQINIKIDRGSGSGPI